MKILLIIIVLLFISLFLFYISNKFKSKSSLWSNIFSGIGTGLISSLIIIISINLTLNQIENNKRKRIEQCAFKILRNPVINHLEFLYRLSNDSGKDINIDIINDFNDDYFDKLSNFDFYKESNYFPPKQWYFIIYYKLTRFYNSIDKRLSTYIFFLDDKIILLLEDIKESSKFFPPSESFDLIKEYYKNENDNSFSSPEIMDGLRKHVGNLLRFVELYNSKIERNKIDEIQVGSV